MDKGITFKQKGRSFEVYFEGASLGKIQSLKSGKFSVNLKKGDKALKETYKFSNEAFRASIKFVKNG
jgi:hypothetical protein